jgi:hypothetical protein
MQNLPVTAGPQGQTLVDGVVCDQLLQAHDPGGDAQPKDHGH